MTAGESVEVVPVGVLPVFALFNAGVAVDALLLRTPASAVPLGIIAGLAFPGTDIEREAKLAILLASVLATAVGITILLATAGPAERGPAAQDH